jgi:hypothetical protein
MFFFFQDKTPQPPKNAKYNALGKKKGGGGGVGGLLR